MYGLPRAISAHFDAARWLLVSDWTPSLDDFIQELIQLRHGENFCFQADACGYIYIYEYDEYATKEQGLSFVLSENQDSPDFWHCFSPTKGARKRTFIGECISAKDLFGTDARCTLEEVFVATSASDSLC